MPFAFQVILIIGATGYILTALLFLITRNMPDVNNGSSWWSFSSLAAAAGYTALLVMGLKGRPDIGEALYNMLFVLWVLGLYLGGKKFLNLETSSTPLMIASLFLVLWLFYFYFISYSFILSASAIALFAGILNLRLAWLFLKNTKYKSKHLYAIVTALSISGIHWLDYPFLRHVESLAPIGFSLCAVVSVIISALFASMVLTKFKNRMLRMRQEALNAANLDPLTRLFNRKALEEHFTLLQTRSQNQNKRMALLFLDLDNFKPVNDELGHKVGDKVLVNIANRMKSLIPKTDILARVGGDEFIIILNNIKYDDDDTVSKFCKEIIQKISEPVNVNEHICHLGVSVGVTYSSKDTKELDELIHTADEAMYKAKANGKNQCVFLSSKLI